MRLPSFAEQQHTIHHSPNLTFTHKLQCFQQLALRTHKRSEEREVSIEDLAQVGTRIKATRSATRHQPAVVFERTDRTRPPRGATMFAHHVNASLFEPINDPRSERCR